MSGSTRVHTVSVSVKVLTYSVKSSLPCGCSFGLSHNPPQQTFAEMSGKKRRPITAHFQICVLWTLRHFVRDSRKDQKGLMKGVLLKQTNQLTQTPSY